MVRLSSLLFKPDRAPPFFCREDAAISACVKHMWLGAIILLRPRRTASHICCIWGNSTPLTGREREAPKTAPVSVERTPPWIAPRSARGDARDTEHVTALTRDTPTAHLRAALEVTCPGSYGGRKSAGSTIRQDTSDLKLRLHRAVGNAPPQVCCRRPFFVC